MAYAINCIAHARVWSPSPALDMPTPGGSSHRPRPLPSRASSTPRARVQRVAGLEALRRRADDESARVRPASAQWRSRNCLCRPMTVPPRRGEASPLCSPPDGRVSVVPNTPRLLRPVHSFNSSTRMTPAARYGCRKGDSRRDVERFGPTRAQGRGTEGARRRISPSSEVIFRA